ncbi:hypothetical protein BKI52_33405 [marine bacterium AO1-C]|nr:hypothetical protein BKI52_33405 [marine bacterium AO1-C]
MTQTNIKTHSTESFRQHFMQDIPMLHDMLKADFGKFFIVRVEDMIRLIKLPVPPTRSTTHTFIFLTEGEAIMTIGNDTYTIYKDECLLVPAGQVFSFTHLDINKGFLCNFQPEMVIGKIGLKEGLNDFDFLNVWGNPRISLKPSQALPVLQMLQRVFQLYTEQGLKQLELIQAYFITVLYELNQAYQPLSKSTQIQAVKLANQFKALLFQHIRSKHLVSDYASLLAITPNHLNKVVKQITDKSPTKWIDETLVLEAKVLLYQTQLSIGEIASEIGIHDSSYFSRLFKKYEKQTPTQFRKMIDKP